MTNTTPQPWPVWMKVLWQGIAVFVLVMQVPAKTKTGPDGNTQHGGWLYNLCPPIHEQVSDFYQEWSSARNWLTGRPIYTPQRETLPIYCGVDLSNKMAYIEYNAHPPSSVLFTLPVGYLDYSTALITWHVFSLVLFLLCGALFLREMQIQPRTTWGWYILPTLAFLAMFDPMRQQFAQGQLNGVLLLLFMGAWIASRRGNGSWAGCWIGVAATIKIFPAFLFVYLLWRKQYRGVVVGLLTGVIITLLTVAVLGLDTYRDYLTTVLPALKEFRCSWVNHSIVGFWHRLFVGSPSEYVTPLFHSPLLAWSLTIASALVLVGLALFALRRTKTIEQQDRGFWLLVTTMLLLGPLTWSHSMLLQVIPVYFLLRDVRFRLPPQACSHGAILLIGGYYLFEQRGTMEGLVTDGWLTKPLTPLGTLLASSLSFYALLTLFILQRRALNRLTTPTAESSSAPTRIAPERPLVAVR